MSVKVSRLFHAGYLLQSRDTFIAFDPIFENPFSRNCYAYPEVELDLSAIRELKLDAVFISHFHDDHCSFESLDLLDKETPLYVFCLHEELFLMLRQLGFNHVYSLCLNQPLVIGDFKITPRRAFDATVDCLLQISVNGLEILNVVDSWIEDQVLEELAKNQWDLVLWPYQTMLEWNVLCPSQSQPAQRQIPEEWILQLKKLNPRYVVPSACQFIHEPWSWYRRFYFPITYKSFRRSIEQHLPQTQYQRFNPLTSWLLSDLELKELEPLSLGRMTGDPLADYDYQPELPVPHTTEVAQNFPVLTDLQRQNIQDYCEKTIFVRYSEVSEPDENYFGAGKVWHLKIYDRAEIIDYFYWVKAGALTALKKTPAQVEWLTEIPAARLWGALSEGESLSSLYIRINDHSFPAEVEAKVREVDLLEDPLLRCLYNGKFGSYQKAQLGRILKARRTTSASLAKTS